MPAPTKTTTDLLTKAARVGVWTCQDDRDTSITFEVTAGVIACRSFNAIRDKARELERLIEFASYEIPMSESAEVMSESAVAAATAALTQLQSVLNDTF